MRRWRIFSPLRVAALLMVYGTCAGAGALYAIVGELDADLPRDLRVALDYRPPQATIVFAADGEPIGQFFLEQRYPVDLDRVPRHVQQAFVSAEDRRFWEHQGFDAAGIARAAWANFRGHGITQGASTITQQVMRMLMLGREKTYYRKARELILAWRVERELSKRDILEIYLNHVYLGAGAYGVQAAAKVYFGKDVGALSVAEAAMLAGLPQSPSRYSPVRDFAAAKARQRYVLDRMVADGALTRRAADAAYDEPLGIVTDAAPLNAEVAPYFVEHVRRWAVDRYGDRSVLLGGLRIHTTLDSRKQRAAEAAVREGLEAAAAWIGFRGPIGHVDGAALAAFIEGPPRPAGGDGPAVDARGHLLRHTAYVGAVVDVRDGWRARVDVDVGPVAGRLRRDDARAALRWRSDRGDRLRIGDLVAVKLAAGSDPAAGEVEWALEQPPDVQGALVAIDPATGRIEAMVGGYDYRTSQFNRAVQARRQVGSSIKPFIYAAALAAGYTHLSIVLDAPVAVPTPTGVWRPKNFKREYRGPITLRTALAESVNTVSVRLVQAVGADAVVDVMRRLGIRSRFPIHPSIALGTPDVSLLEMTAAYAALPAGGLRVDPRFVDVVTTAEGVVLEDHRAERPHDRALSPQLAYLVTDLMRGVVRRGTARRARELRRPAAGKTGTSSEFRDAWFIGFTPDAVAGVWVGRDDFTPIAHNATGGRLALPIWLRYMQAAEAGRPIREFSPPEDILFVRASERTGRPAPPGAPDAALVPMLRGTIPEAFLAAVEPAAFRPPPPAP
ncbi:MAG: PBP1A family penicillin-binding protein [Deltaproteobacteria bacterium]|nr:MAG: PBP1A family penicillin-binding protein [Deltaproteobacteria bacterium]